MKKQNNSVYNDFALIHALDSMITYDKICTKSKCTQLLSLCVYLMNRTEYADNKFYLNDHTFRESFGRKIVNGKQIWVLSYILNELVEVNVLERTNYHFGDITSHSRIYGFTNAFINKYNEIYPRIELYEDLMYYMHRESENKKTDSQYKLLISERFNIDDSVIDWIASNLTGERRMSNLKTVIDIYNKNIFVSKHELTGRIFTSFTSLKREIRKFCTIDGEHLSSIDIKSCHPLLLFNLLRKKFVNHVELDMLKEILDADIYEHFRNRFIELYKGNSYIEFDGMIKTIDNRDDAKVEFFRFMFKRTNIGKPGPFELIFKNDFPFLYEKICEIRKETELWILLQKMEAEIFIPVVSKFVKKGCLSLHDGIYFKSELRDEIIKALEESLDKHNIIGYQLKEK